ncbi:MAG: aldose 1-epimerase family protein [Aerococcus sp.]|nr:aldose 1-epimerase family protein [Aerococcus sp.]
MDYLLHNDQLTINASTNAAQLQSLRRNDANFEYIFQGFPDFWGWQTPTLFPHCGRLEDDYMEIDGKRYDSKQHGFARHSIFEAEDVTDDAITFLLTENDETLQSFPYHFELRIGYQLDGNKVRVKYSVKNTNDGEMSFSIGAHPAFNVPLAPGETFEDYQLTFDSTDEVNTYGIGEGNLIHDTTGKPVKLANRPLTRDQFKDGLELFELRDQTVTVGLENSDRSHGLRLNTNGFPYVGIWSPYPTDATFVCIEPWFGLPDVANGNHDFVKKAGNLSLASGETFDAEFILEPF